jgi:hypothetical protein
VPSTPLPTRDVYRNHAASPSLVRCLWAPTTNGTNRTMKKPATKAPRKAKADRPPTRTPSTAELEQFQQKFAAGFLANMRQRGDARLTQIERIALNAELGTAMVAAERLVYHPSMPSSSDAWPSILGSIFGYCSAMRRKRRFVVCKVDRRAAAEHSDEDEEPSIPKPNLKKTLVSKTAQEKGYAFPRVSFLTKEERAHARAGGLVLFKSTYPSRKLGTYWRRCVSDGYLVRPRIATPKQIAYVEKVLRRNKRASNGSKG